MKQKSYKLRKLEQKRYSILTDDLEHCYICGAVKEDIHEIYGGSNRVNSMKNGFCIPLCRYCHRVITDRPLMALSLKIETQKIFENTHSRDEFMKIIGRNYLLGE